MLLLVVMSFVSLTAVYPGAALVAACPAAVEYSVYLAATFPTFSAPAPLWVAPGAAVVFWGLLCLVPGAKMPFPFSDP